MTIPVDEMRSVYFRVCNRIGFKVDGVSLFVGTAIKGRVKVSGKRSSRKKIKKKIKKN